MRSVAWYWYVLPVLVAAYVFGQTWYVMLSRFSYPYELEWIEGGMLQSVARIVDGLPLYASPSMEYVPSLYAPFYFYLSAAATALLGVGLPALRLVSLLAALGTVLMVSASVWKLTRSRWAALLAMLCWGAVYRFSGAYYDLARVDSLWAFFVTAAITALIFFTVQKKNIWLGVCTVFLVLAVFTKQTSLMLLPFFMLAIWCWAGFCRAAWVSLFLLAAIAVIGSFFQWQSQGLFFFYTVEMARTHGFNNGLPWNFLHGDLMWGVPIYLLLSVAFVLLQVNRRDKLAWSALLLGFFLVSLFARWYTGGWFNVLIPFHQLLVIMAICGLYVLLQFFQQLKNFPLRVVCQGLVVFLLTVNIARGDFEPGNMLPTKDDRACGDTLVKRIAAVDTNVCILRHDYLAILAGKKVPCAHEAFVVDLLNGSDKSLAESLLKDIRSELLAGRYAVLLADSDGQFNGYGVKWHELPYIATDITDCAIDAFYPKTSGQRPRHWLEYNGRAMDDRRTSVKH